MVPSIPYSLSPTPSRRIGMMGGTFDPVHWGHLILAEQAREQFDLESVLFVTAADPPHKQGERVTEARHRLEMTRLAIAGDGHFELSTVEMDRPGPSYTIDTVKQILEAYGAGTSLFLLLGTDEGRDLMKWREPYEIQRLARIVVANRPGVPESEVLEALPEEFAKQIAPMRMPGVDISSTDLRERVRQGRSIRYLVPRQVEDYIRQEGLYRD